MRESGERLKSPLPADTRFLLVGPPGCGKTLAARALHALLPIPDDFIELAAIWSVSGLSWPTDVPLRAPHHTVSEAGLIGGGGIVPCPGEVSLAHGGILFLDELAEFRQHPLDALGVVLREGEVHLGHRWPCSYPARPAVVMAASNPCPCGGARECRCPPDSIPRYRERLRRLPFDLVVPTKPFDVRNVPVVEPADEVRLRIEIAREELALLQPEERSVARTIAELAGSTNIEAAARRRSPELRVGRERPRTSTRVGPRASGARPPFPPMESTMNLQRPAHLSVSQLNQYLGCPRAYFFRYIEHAEQEFRSAAFAFGTAWHRVFAAWLVENPGTDPLVDLFRSALDTEMTGDVPVLFDEDQSIDGMTTTARGMIAVSTPRCRGPMSSTRSSGRSAWSSRIPSRARSSRPGGRRHRRDRGGRGQGPDLGGQERQEEVVADRWSTTSRRPPM